jgi:endonuclease/exonuclease/phosphatase family metal-dependent hydrolase
MDVTKGKKILCGDFNLLPNTESIAMLEKGMKNLVKEYGITSTRSHHYTKEHKFADYIIVSTDIKVANFEVLQEPVSDHLPLLLEF